MATLGIIAKVHADPASLARASQALGELAAKARNPAGGLRLIGEKLLTVQNQRFRAMEGPDGTPWAKLRPLTLETGGKNTSIMRRSGLLMRSGNAKVSGSTLSVGISGVQAGVQQFGKTIVPKKGSVLAIPMGPRKGGRNGAGFAFAKKVTIPARPMVGFGPKDEKATREGVRAWLAIDGKG
jgi:phage gpG-like protein